MPSTKLIRKRPHKKVTHAPHTTVPHDVFHTPRHTLAVPPQGDEPPDLRRSLTGFTTDVIATTNLDAPPMPSFQGDSIGGRRRNSRRAFILKPRPRHSNETESLSTSLEDIELITAEDVPLFLPSPPCTKSYSARSVMQGIGILTPKPSRNHGLQLPMRPHSKYTEDDSEIDGGLSSSFESFKSASWSPGGLCSAFQGSCSAKETAKTKAPPLKSMKELSATRNTK